MCKHIVAVGNDVLCRLSQCGSILIENMMVAGKA
jgi:hypothetical protein